MLLFGGLFPLMSVGFFTAAAVKRASYEQARELGVVTDGTVVRIEESRGGDGVAYATVVAFRTEDGGGQAFVSPPWSSNPQYAVGDRVTVLYQRENPRDAAIETAFARHGEPALLAGSGLVVLLAGALAALMVKKLFSAEPAKPAR